uniref:Innexin n=1 Tax=Panagrolaimus davidi TaxID=227884 RepID=A0A914QT18_9BILA
MLGIPFITTYISRVVKLQTVADSVDWLNYYATSLLLAFFAFMISAKQYFGSPIQCFVPQEFRGGWEKYAENYCFINNMYRVPFDQYDIPNDPTIRDDKLSYYRWVPIVLALQALAFYIPNYIWNMLHKQTAVNPRAIVNEVRKCRESHGNEREKEVETLAMYITETIDEFSPRYQKSFSRNGWNATILYLMIKFLYLINCFGQLFMLDKFLGGNYLTWGFETLIDVAQGQSWKESEMFPRVILCDFEVRKLANIQNYTVQCVIMMNMINEKLYLFLYCWLLLVGIVTLCNFVYYIVILCLPYFRTSFILLNVNKSHRSFHDFSRKEFRRFVHDFLRPDGVLLLQFIRQHAGGRVTYDLVNELLRIFKGRYASSIESSPPTLKGFRGENFKNNLSEHAPSTYKATGYGPSTLYPTYQQSQMDKDNNYPSSASGNGQNDSSDLDYIDNQATLPISQAQNRTPIRPIIPSNVPSSTPRRSSNGRTPSAPNENLYGIAPKASSSAV